MPESTCLITLNATYMGLGRDDVNEEVVDQILADVESSLVNVAIIHAYFDVHGGTRPPWIAARKAESKSLSLAETSTRKKVTDQSVISVY